MMRDSGLRRTWLLTGALAAAGVAGTVAVGLAARAADAGATTIDSVVPSPGPSGAASPALSAGDSTEPGQATSGGS